MPAIARADDTRAKLVADEVLKAHDFYLRRVAPLAGAEPDIETSRTIQTYTRLLATLFRFVDRNYLSSQAPVHLRCALAYLRTVQDSLLLSVDPAPAVRRHAATSEQITNRFRMLGMHTWLTSVGR